MTTDAAVQRRLFRVVVRCSLNAALSVAILLAPPAVGAQSWPSKPIRMIVPGAAGASTDLLGRLTAQALSERLSVPVVVENRAGASGIIGVDVVAHAVPDGYTLLWTGQDTQILVPLTRKNLPYDINRDLTPIAKVGDLYMLLAVNPAFPVKTMQELVARAKASPGSIKFSSSGEGGINHLMVELLKERADIDLLHVPYKGGAPAVQALLAGDVDLYGGSTTNLASLVGSNRLRGLAIAKPTRDTSMPDVPTMAEAGYPNFVVSAWFGLYAPAGLPQHIAERLSSAVVSIASSPEFAAKFAKAGAETAPLARGAFAKYVAEDTSRWRGVIEAAGIKPSE